VSDTWGLAKVVRKVEFKLLHFFKLRSPGNSSLSPAGHFLRSVDNLFWRGRPSDGQANLRLGDLFPSGPKDIGLRVIDGHNDTERLARSQLYREIDCLID
jgi:hypothetical protein